MRVLLAVGLLLAAIGAGCGGNSREDVIVGAAASLRLPMSDLAAAYERETGIRVRVESAGSGALAARIREGVPIDVFVSADPALSQTLADEGTVSEPRTIAGNELVVIAGERTDVRQAADIAREGVRLAIGVRSVPVGAYARTALGRWGAEVERQALDNVRTEEIDARGLTAKLDQGVIDAALAYRTDAEPITRPVRVLPLPDGIGPDIRYVASTVSDSTAAVGFVEWLTTPTAQTIFMRRGFGAP